MQIIAYWGLGSLNTEFFMISTSTTHPGIAAIPLSTILTATIPKLLQAGLREDNATVRMV